MIHVTKYKSRDHLISSFRLWRYFDLTIFRQKTLLSGISNRFVLSEYLMSFYILLESKNEQITIRVNSYLYKMMISNIHHEYTTNNVL